MNESEFKTKWISEKPLYSAWGKYILQTIKKAIDDKGKDINVFLKIPPKYRLKTEESLIDKAFYRPDKNYKDPYDEIEDKVGIRFVVLLVDDIKEICDIIEKNKVWVFDSCKHFEKDKENNPLLFTYQSVHYILRPAIEISFDDILIPISIPCEIQIRTLLQHAHAELTHDAIYKAKKTIRPKIHRTVAKSMALIETTDDFFTEVTKDLYHGPLQEYKILERLDSLYLSLTGLQSHNQKSAIAIWDTFELFVNEDLVDTIIIFIAKYPFLIENIKMNYGLNTFYSQSTVLFVYWMLKRKTQRLLNDWPLPIEILDPLMNDLGISTTL